MTSSIANAISLFFKEHNYPKTPLKAVLFDMDGVLFDSMKNHTAAWYQTISARGIICKREEFYIYEGATGKGVINILYNRTFHRDATEQEVQEIYNEKSAKFNTLPRPEAMEGAPEVMRKVIEHGLMPVLVTGSGQKTLLERLNRSYPNVFQSENMVTAYDVEHGKPHPEPYLRGLEKAGCQPWEAIVVENAPMGTQAGKAAGIFTISVNTGPLPDQILLNAGANLLYPSMSALAFHLDGIISEFAKK